MRVALPIWEGRVSPLLDVARHVLLVTVEEHHLREQEERPLSDESLSARAGQLAAWQVQTVICGAVSQELAGLLAHRGIRVQPHVCGPVEAVLAAFAGGTLPTPALTMPGCGRGHRRRHGWRCQCRGGGRGRRSMP